MGCTKAKRISEQNHAPNSLNKEKIILDTETIRNFHGLKELPLCCDLTSNMVIIEKLGELPNELQAELNELMEYGFQPYAMKDWITKDILGEILNVDPNSLRDEKFRKLKLDFRDPRSWDEILKGSGKFYRAWKAGNYAGLHEVFFSAFLNRVLTEAEEYLHSSFTRNHPKIRVYTREVIDFLDNKFDPDENHGRIVADTSALTEIYAATQTAKLQSFMLYLTHDLSFEEARELVKNSTTLITKKGAAGNSFDYLITVDREKLGCEIKGDKPRFLITYGEVKGVTEHYTEKKGSRGTYLETLSGSNNGNRIMIGEDFMVKVSEIRYHLKDRFDKLNWDYESITELYEQIAEDYAAMVPIGRLTKGRSRFKEMFNDRRSSRSPYFAFSELESEFIIKRIEYPDLLKMKNQEFLKSGIQIIPNNSDKFRRKYSVFVEGQNFNDEIIYPYVKSSSKKIQRMIDKKFGKLSRRMITYIGTSQNGQSSSIKCGFSGRLGGVKDNYLSVQYIAESILNSKNSISYGSSHLIGNKRNKRWGKLGATALNASKFADPEIALQNDILKYYKELYKNDTTKATNFRRSRRENWRRSINNLKNDRQINEAIRYQSYANKILSKFHEYITSFNTKIQRFRPIDEID